MCSFLNVKCLTLLCTPATQEEIPFKDNGTLFCNVMWKPSVGGGRGHIFLAADPDFFDKEDGEKM